MKHSPFTPAHEAYLRNLYQGDMRHCRKMRNLVKFFTLYAIAGALTVGAYWLFAK